MYVCICHGISDHDIRRMADEGCRDLTELTMRTGCGSSCGSCRELAGDVLRDAQQRRDLPLRVLAA